MKRRDLLRGVAGAVAAAIAPNLPASPVVTLIPMGRGTVDVDAYLLAEAGEVGSVYSYYGDWSGQFSNDLSGPGWTDFAPGAEHKG